MRHWNIRFGHAVYSFFRQSATAPVELPWADSRKEYVEGLEGRVLLSVVSPLLKLNQAPIVHLHRPATVRPLARGRLSLAVSAATQVAMPTASTLISSTQVWGATTNITLPTETDQPHVVNPLRFTGFTLQGSALRASLAAAPLEFTAEAGNPLSLSLPQPDGTYARFAVVEAPIMEDGLAAQFPNIKTYRGQGLDDPTATLRMDITPLGFHAQVLTGEGGGSWYIDPYQFNVPVNGGTYASYFRTDLAVPTDVPNLADDIAPGVGGGSSARSLNAVGDLSNLSTSALTPLSLTSGANLRTYRAAVAADGEYSAFFGGTLVNAQAAIVTSINRVTGIYEKEVSCRLVLVANNSSIVYTNASTDPYTNTSPSTLLTQNQSTIDSVIGTANYDIGHVFTTGGGGLAGLGVVCRAGQKAQGETGSGSPVGDAYDVDYVAHEMGHQFGGNHTFNGVNGSASGNANGSTAMEPGSGSTIQAYAGICGADDLQTNSDAYFHSVSLDEIIAYTTTGAGNAVAAVSTGNTAPTVNAGLDYAIPTGTPFALTASGSDANNDALTYCWEERDTGALQALSAADNGASPIFRSFNPTTSPTRTFPRLSNLLANTLPAGEKLPSVARTMKFRVVARDNRSGGGGIGTDDAVVTVVNTGAPFLVTSPNTAVSWAAGSTQTVSWDVAGTRNAPISAYQVNIRLSTDGGNTFPVVLAAGSPNDGSQTVNLPFGLTSSNARIKVEAVGNIFFDLSNVNFSLTSGAIAADRFESNGSIATATDLGTTAARTENQLTIHTVGDEDYFKFAATTAGTYTASLAFTNAQGNIDLAVYDAAGNVVGTSNTTGDTEQVTFNATTWQTFYVRAFGVSGATNPNFGLMVTGPTSASSIAADAFEPNDSFSTAWDLGNLRSRTDSGLTIHSANNDDYFKLKAAAAGSMTVSLAFTNSQGNVDLFVYNSGQTLVGSSTSATDAESVTFTVTSGATYYVKVAGASGATSPLYAMTISGPTATGDRFEANDSFAAAYDFAGTSDRIEAGLSIHAANNDDYFKITPTVSGTMNVSIAFTNSAGDLDLYLYNSTPTQIFSSAGITNTETVSGAVTAGQAYYVKVIGFNGATNSSYSLTIDVPGAATSVAVTGPQFFGAINPPYLKYGFGQDVSASLSLADLVVQNLSTSSTVTPASLVYDLGSNVATVNFASSLPAGNYRATLTAAGVTNSAGTAIAANSVFDFSIAATVTGTVFLDADSSGIRESGELAIAGTTVFVDSDLNGTFTPGEPNTLSAGDGTYTFSGLTSGTTYRVRVTPPAGYIAVGPAIAGIDAVAPASSVNLGLVPTNFTAAGDYTLRLDGTGTKDQILLGGVLQFTLPKTLPAAFSFSPTTAGADSLTIDLSAGDPIPAGGISFDGGTGTNTLAVLGSAAADTFSLAASTLTVNGKSVSFAGGTSAINISGNEGNDALTLLASTSASVRFDGGLTATDQDLLTISAGTYKLLADPSATSAHLTVANNATLDLNGVGATVAALIGSGTVTNSLSSPASISIAGGSTLGGVSNGAGTFSGVIASGTGGVALEKKGTGTFTLTGVNTYVGVTVVTGGTLDASAGSISSSAGAMTIANAGSTLIARQIAPSSLVIGTGATVQLTNTDHAGDLSGRSTIGTLTNNGLLDVGGTGVIVASVADESVIRAQIIAGRGSVGGVSGAWTGTSGITSSTARVDGSNRAVGYVVNGAQVIIAQTLLGDSTLDGRVNVLDRAAYLSNAGGSGKTWQQADFNFDGFVNVLDRAAYLSHAGQSLP